MLLPFYILLAVDLTVATNFNTIHRRRPLCNAILGRIMKPYTIHLNPAIHHPSCGHYVRETICQPPMTSRTSKPRFLGDFEERCKRTYGTWWATRAFEVAFTEFVRSWYPSFVVDTFLRAIFDVALDVEVPLGLLPRARNDFMLIFIGSSACIERNGVQACAVYRAQLHGHWSSRGDPNRPNTTTWFLWEHCWVLPLCNKQCDDREIIISANCSIVCPWMLREAKYGIVVQIGCTQ